MNNTISTTSVHSAGNPGAPPSPIEVTLDERGAGRPFLLLHGGGGPQSVSGFAELLATTRKASVITPVHPGFAGTTRPEELTSVAGIAAVYAGLLEQRDLRDVAVVGNSMGGWIAAELALLQPSRISSLVIVDGVGIEVPGHPVVDFFSLTMDQVAEHAYHNPAGFRIDPSALPPAAQAMLAANRAALAVYSGQSMSDPGLAARLAGIAVPTLVVWGEADRIADVDYGRAFAAAIPNGRFLLLRGTGHLPQIETPDQLLRAVWEFAASNVSHRPTAQG